MRRSFCKCRRASWNGLAGRMRPAGRNLPTPAIVGWLGSIPSILYTEKLKTGTCCMYCPASYSAFLGGCKAIIFEWCCHWFANWQSCHYCIEHCGSSLVAQGSSNHGPWGKSGPRSLLIRPRVYFIRLQR